MPDFSIEDSFGGVVAGIDEAGRGPWCGPVVAAAVVLNRDNFPIGINDSKKLSHKRREEIFIQLQEFAKIGVGIATVEEIDTINILQASMLAMQRAFAALPFAADVALVDGNKIPKLSCPAHYVIKGDSKSLSIAAASIIAKVTRDNIMFDLARQYPQYGWEKNSGYGTKDHQKALLEFGVTPHHRKTYKPVAKMLENIVIEV